MRGKPLLYLDQYGQVWHAKTIRSLREQIGGKVSKMYVDTKDGNTVQIGYVIGRLWLRFFTPLRIPS